MANKNPNNSTQFSEDYQPINRRGESKTKILNDYIFARQDYNTPPLAKMINYMHDMLWMKNDTIIEIKNDDEAPNILRTIAEGLNGDKKLIFTQQLIELISKQDKKINIENIELPQIQFSEDE